MKIGIYARESSADLSKAPPIQAQIERGKQWASQNNHEVVIVYMKTMGIVVAIGIDPLGYKV